jgi:hypothetical protein
VAALRDVDLVAVSHNEGWRAAIEGVVGVRIVDDPQGEAARSAEFVQFVLGRQQRA